VSVPERYLGLTMPHEQDSTKQQQGSRAATGSTLVANAQSAPPVPDYLSRLAQHVSTHVDLDQLLKVAASIDPSGTATGCNQQEQLVQQQQHQHQQQLSVSDARHALPLLKTPGRPHRCRIAVARDEAFCFYYQVCRRQTGPGRLLPCTAAACS
jgi:cobyrinic acid a,c-diamide synthase